MAGSRLVTFFLVAFFCFVGVSTGRVYAQEADSAGVKVTPATIEKMVTPGQELKETLIFTNIGIEEREFYLYKRNIKGVEGEGTPVFADEGAPLTGFEITEWVSLSEEPIVIPGKGEFRYELVIKVPEDASPGSHFGGIFISAEPPRLREIGAGVGYQVGSILSLRVDGDVIDDARIRALSTDKLFYGSKHVKFLAKIENQGNILIRPRGPLTIESMLGGDPEVISVNESQHGVFPGAVRDFEIKWEDDGIGFGRYTAILALSYDGEGGQKTIDASVVFWVFPTKVMVPILVILLLLVGLFYLFTRLYIRRMMLEAGGVRRVVPQRVRRQVGISRFAFVFVSIMAVLVLFLIVLLIFFA